MKLKRTAKIKIDMTVSEILPTIQSYTNAFNFICNFGYPLKIKNKITLHKRIYYDVKEYLPSQLTVSAITKASEALASAFTKSKHKKLGSQPKSKLCSIRYDKNSYSIKDNLLSLSTISGRKKKIPLSIPKYYQEYFDNWKRKSAELCIIKNKVYLHIVFEKEVTDASSTGNVVGIDRGINNLAVTSNNKFFGGKVVKKQVRKYQKLRSSLQSNGSKSAKRHLKRLSLKEQRFRRDINHCISKSIIRNIPVGSTIVLEDLKGIRKNKLRKAQRTMLNNWSYFQLEQFITYKAMMKGIDVMHIDAAYTSQRCSKCGFVCKTNRNKHSFSCKSCSFKLNSDLNASRNIRIKHLDAYKASDRADINQPIVEASVAIYKPSAFLDDN